MLFSIDEAIAHEREKADKNSECWKHCTSEKDCKTCEKENVQLAEWLEELKDYRDKNKMVVRIDCVNSDEFKDIAVKLEKEQYNKAIDDLLEDANEMAIEVDTGTYTMKAIGIGLLEQIAEQLKAGENQ